MEMLLQNMAEKTLITVTHREDAMSRCNRRIEIKKELARTHEEPFANREF
jgi:ABC-type lipoprotein export system ATPase subunit